mmetsp:Transcript_7049/g.8919  ORF Transcript_7049/g.8919 Transcript_7049/m.8919 type:complete len:114 (+) Transcript_7049:271-612(+)
MTLVIGSLRSPISSFPLQEYWRRRRRVRSLDNVSAETCKFASIKGSQSSSASNTIPRKPTANGFMLNLWNNLYNKEQTRPLVSPLKKDVLALLKGKSISNAKVQAYVEKILEI